MTERLDSGWVRVEEKDGCMGVVEEGEVDACVVGGCYQGGAVGE